MRYLKILIAGISFAVIINVLGIIVGLVKCISSGLEVDSSTILSVALGIGAREGIFGGFVVMALMLIGGQGRRPRP